MSGNKVGTGFPACANLSLSGRASCFRLSGIIRKGKKEFLLFEYPDGSVPVWDKGTVDGYTVGKIYADSVVVCKAGRNYTLMLN